MLDKRAKMCYNKSMKRIDVLKGIEQILVQKAYETGHISHRADGDWQKQADGSWKPYKGQSAPQTQENSPTENNNNDDSELKSYISNEYYNDIANMPVDSNNPDLPDSDVLYEIVDSIVEDLDIDDDDQYEKISEMVQDVWSQNNPSDEVEKSAVRDMRSTPTTKNMGF